MSLADKTARCGGVVGWFDLFAPGPAGCGLVGGSVGFGKDGLLVGVDAYLPLFGVEEGVVPAAEEYAVVYGGGAAVLPVDAVVGVPPARWSVAMGEAAVAVS